MVKQLRTYFEVIRSNISIVVPMGLYYFWLGITFQSPDFALSDTVDPFTAAPWLISSVSYAIGYLVLVVWCRKIVTFFLNKWFLVAVCVAMSSGSLISVASRADVTAFTAFSPWLDYLGMIVTCAGATFVIVITASLVVFNGVRVTLLVSLAGMFLAAVVMIGMDGLGLLDADLFKVLLPLLLIPANLVAFRRLPLTRVFTSGFEKKTVWPLKLLATAALHGFAFGFLVVAYSVLDVEGSTALFNGSGYIVAALLLLAVMLFVLRTDFNQLMYYEAFPIMALGILLVALDTRVGAFGLGIIAVGFAFLHVALDGVSSYLSRQFGINAPWIISLDTFSLAAGQTLGVGFSLALLQMGVPLSSVASCFLFVVLVGALCLSGAKNVRLGWGVVRLSAGNQTMSPREWAVQQLSLDKGLTSRETEIAMHLADGQSRKQIAEELTVSDQTVKSHVSHIYAKLDVHSKEELAALIERNAQSFEE